MKKKVPSTLSYIEVQQFYGGEDEKAFRSFLHLKYSIFVAELGFDSFEFDEKEELAAPDKFDDKGLFALAKDHHGAPVGIARGLLIEDVFPHQKLFEHHLLSSHLKPLRKCLSTINALGVVSNMRKQLVSCQGINQKATIGRVLLIKLVDWFREKQAKVVLLSSNLHLARRFFVPVGFYIIDPVIRYDLSPEPVVNLALLLNDTGYLTGISSPFAEGYPETKLTAQELEVKSYFEELHSQYVNESLQT